MMNSDEITNDDKLFALIEYRTKNPTERLAFKSGFMGKTFDEFKAEYSNPEALNKYEDIFIHGKQVMAHKERIQETCEDKADEIIDTLCNTPDEVIGLIMKRFRWFNVSDELYADLEEEANENKT